VELDVSQLQRIYLCKHYELNLENASFTSLEGLGVDPMPELTELCLRTH